MVGLDSNILVYAHREDSRYNEKAIATLNTLIHNNSLIGIAWPSIYEFYRVVTNPSFFDPISPRNVALKFINELFELPVVKFLGHGSSHFEHMTRLAEATDASGVFVFDLQIGTILLEHGIRKIYSNDADFRRFRDLEVVNPFS